MNSACCWPSAWFFLFICNCTATTHIKVASSAIDTQGESLLSNLHCNCRHTWTMKKKAQKCTNSDPTNSYSRMVSEPSWIVSSWKILKYATETSITLACCIRLRREVCNFLCIKYRCTIDGRIPHAHWIHVCTVLHAMSWCTQLHIEKTLSSAFICLLSEKFFYKFISRWKSVSSSSPVLVPFAWCILQISSPPVFSTRSQDGLWLWGNII